MAAGEGGLDRRQFLGRTGALVAAASAVAAPTALARARRRSSGARETGVLRIAVSKDTESLDANNIAFIRSDEMCANIYDTPMWWPLVPGKGFRYPEAAPSFVKSVRINSKKTQFTFTIPTNKRFASGKPVTVDDVVWSLQRIGQGGLGVFYYGVTNVPDPKNPVEKLNDTQFRITTAAPSNFLLQVLSTESFAIFEKAELLKHATDKDPWALEWSKTNAAGGGAYVLTKATPGVGSELKRNPYYKGPMPVNFERVSLPIVPSVSDRVSLLKRGDVDIAQEIPKQRLKELSEDPSIRIYRRPSTYQHYLLMNTKVGPFTNKLVRQAVSHALPIDTIIKNVFFGYARPLVGPVPSLGLYRNPNLKGYDYNIAKAKQLMEKAGVKGFSVDFHFDPITSPENGPLAAVVQSSLAQIGIKVNLKPLQPAPFAEQKFAKKFEFFLDQIIYWVDDPAYGLGPFTTTSFFNYTRYSNSKFDRLREQLTNETNAAKRRALAYEAQKILLEDAPFAWMVSQDIAYAVRKDIKGFYPHPTDMMYYGPMMRA